jgi:hypothetical protein
MADQCAICQIEREGKLYEIYFGHEQLLHLPNIEIDDNAYYEVKGSRSIYICYRCVAKKSLVKGVVMSLLSIPLLLIGVLVHLAAQEGIGALAGLLLGFPILGVVALIKSLTFFFKPSKRKGIGENLAIKALRKTIQKETGATDFWDHLPKTNEELLRHIRLLESLQTQKSIHSQVQHIPSPTDYIPKRTGEETIEITPVSPESTPDVHSLPDIQQKAIEPTQAQIQAINTAWIFSIISALTTFLMAYFQILNGGFSLIPAIINIGAGVMILLVASTIKKREPRAYQNGIRMAKGSAIWIAGQLAIINGLGGEIDKLSSCIILGWLICDGLIYFMLKQAKEAFPGYWLK